VTSPSAVQSVCLPVGRIQSVQSSQFPCQRVTFRKSATQFPCQQVAISQTSPVQSVSSPAGHIQSSSVRSSQPACQRVTFSQSVSFVASGSHSLPAGHIQSVSQFPCQQVTFSQSSQFPCQRITFSQSSQFPCQRITISQSDSQSVSFQVLFVRFLAGSYLFVFLAGP
jgi:hypothetical protein